MKPFSLFKIPVLLVGFGALALFTPACKAQSEVSPDHFDGTDSWEVAAHKSVNSPLKPAMAQNKKPVASMQMASVREVVRPIAAENVALQDKKKLSAQKRNKQ